MTLFRWSVVAVIAGVTGSGAPSTAAAPPTAKAPNVANVASVATANASKATQHESEPRVEIGPAVLYLYDETGRIIAVE